MEATELLLFIIPAIIAVLTLFLDLKISEKNDNGNKRNFFQRITFAGYVVIFLSIITFVLGLKNQSDNKQTDKDYQGKIDSLNAKSDSLRIDTKVLKDRSEMYYQVLTVLGYKLDTTTVEGRRQTDSLLGVILGQKMLLEKKKPYIDLCTVDSNLTITRINNRYTVKFFLCNFGNANGYKTKVEYEFIRLNQGRMTILPKAGKYLHNSDGAFRNDSHLITDFWLEGSTINTDTIYVYFKGSYEDEQGKSFSFKTIVVKYPNQNRFFYTNEDALVAPKAFLQSMNLW